MKELILDYAKQDSEFEKSLESLKERYFSMCKDKNVAN